MAIDIDEFKILINDTDENKKLDAVAMASQANQRETELTNIVSKLEKDLEAANTKAAELKELNQKLYLRMPVQQEASTETKANMFGEQPTSLQERIRKLKNG